MKPRMVMLAAFAILTGLCVDAFAQTRCRTRDAELEDSHRLACERRTPRLLLRRRQVRRRARRRQGIDDGRRHVRGSDGAEADPVAVSGRLFPRRRADGSRLAADARWPAGLGLQLPRHGLRRLSPGLPDARPVAVRAGRGRHAGSVESEHPHGEQPRGDLHGRRGARRLPAGEEAQPVAGHRPHRRQGLRRFQQDAGAVPRRESPGDADA